MRLPKGEAKKIEVTQLAKIAPRLLRFSGATKSRATRDLLFGTALLGEVKAPPD
jgi:hypothetical protein